MARKPHGSGTGSATSSGRRTSATAPSEAAQPTQIRVRMYRVGLGDCFLVSLLPPRRNAFHIMVDCGVILGTKKAKERLAQALDDIIEETGSKKDGGRVDVLVVTHEHYDHVAGFALCPEKFAAAGDREPGKLSVDEVWFAWTEKRGDELADRLRKKRQERKEALASLVSRLTKMGVSTSEGEGVADLLRFFGVGRDGRELDASEGMGATALAMRNARQFASKVTYCEPGQVWESQAAPGMRTYFLGPPRDEKAFRKLDSTTEVYHFGGQFFEDSVRMAASMGASSPENDLYAPFDSGYRRKLSLIVAGKDTGAAANFVRESYLRSMTESPETDVSWRRIDGEWLGSAEQLALALDSATNNTSLAFAIELTDSGRVLLFPADAQVGNWLSWHGISWESDGVTVTAEDLLSRTVFYKVGHHGSHNATLKGRGLQLMPANGLVAFLSVHEEMAQVKRWFDMPLPHLLQALEERCGDAVIRIDAEVPPGLQGISSGGAPGSFPTLYHEWLQSVAP